MNRWQATHEITGHLFGRRYRRRVRLLDGAAYTKAEWEAAATADWSVTVEGAWLFQGQAPVGTYKVRALRRGRPPGRPENVRRRLVVLRLTEEEHALVAAAAKAADVAVAEWMRGICLDAASMRLAVKRSAAAG